MYRKNGELTMKTIKIIFTILIFYFTQSMYSFPGDHNSLTCQKNMVVESDAQYPNEGELRKALINSDPTIVKNARDYIERNKLAILEKIKNDYPRNPTYDITMWGDSLTDFVDYYGNQFPWFFGRLERGDYGGSDLIYDSFDDYFSIFGNSTNEPFKVGNLGVASQETIGLLKQIGITPFYDEANQWWDIEQNENHCVNAKLNNFDDEAFKVTNSSPRSLVMVGGNDVAHGFVPGIGTWLPFVNKYVVDHTLENITFIIDWNIENGKKVLIEGTVPSFSNVVAPYNSSIVNRTAMCRPMNDSLIEPDEIPWWMCGAFGSTFCATMAMAAKASDEAVISAFNDFTDKVMEGNKTLHGDYSGETYSNHVFTIISINQACINDRLELDFGPSYNKIYPNNVEYKALYNTFNTTGDNFTADNFWLPKPELYRKFANISKDDTLDAAHFGPLGYKLWSDTIASSLASKGWNREPTSDELPEPIISLDNNGPGYKIKKKSKEVNLFGKEKDMIKTVWNNNHKGFYREYKDNNVIYLQQVKDYTPTADVSTLYGEPHHLHGIILDKYLELNGTEGDMGFPVSDVYCYHFCSIDKVEFECGAIEHNKLDFLNPTYVFHTEPKPEGCK